MIKDRKREKTNNLVDRAKSANRFIFIRRGEDMGKEGLRLMSSLTEKQMKGKDTNISASCFPSSHPSMETDENWHQWSAEWQQVSLMPPFFIFRSHNNRDSRERGELEKDRKIDREVASTTPWHPGSLGLHWCPHWSLCLPCSSYSSCVCASGGCRPPRCHVFSCCCC